MKPELASQAQSASRFLVLMLESAGHPHRTFVALKRCDPFANPLQGMLSSLVLPQFSYFWPIRCNISQDAAKGGCGLGGACRHTKTVKTAKTAKTANGLEGRVASPVFPGPMSAVIAAGKKPPEPPKPSKPPKPSNATHPLDHTPPLQHLESGHS